MGGTCAALSLENLDPQPVPGAVLEGLELAVPRPRGERAMPWSPPALPHLRLSVRLRAGLECRLPPFHGSMLRGALGMALRRAVCTRKMETQCRRCPSRHSCVYTRIFETYVEGETPPLMGGSIHAPRPLVIEPRCRRQDFSEGDPLDFDVLLLGSAAQYHPFLALAIERMARTGLGFRRAPFVLDSLRFREQDGEWSSELPNGGTLSPDSLRLHFLTPTRLLVHKRLERQPSFGTLVFKMARRVQELAFFHAPGQPLDWDLGPLRELAEAVTVRRSDLRWVDLQRYSNRQRRKLSAAGLVGTLHLEGDFAPFIPLLAAASVVHVGKGATMGLGRVAAAPGS